MTAATEYDSKIRSLRKAFDAVGSASNLSGRALLDQCAAEMRDYLDLRGVAVSDKTQLRAMIAAVYFVAEMAASIKEEVAEKIAVNTLEVLAQFVEG